MAYNPQCIPNSRPLFMWAILLALTLFVFTLIVMAPVASANGHGFLAATFYQAFGHVCHQQPDRSFFLAGKPLAVCARCTGIYLGLVLATLCYPIFISLRRTNPPEVKWLFLSFTPLTIDFSLGALGIWQNTHSSRFLTGALFGATLIFYLMPALSELSQRFVQRRSRQPQPVT